MKNLIKIVSLLIILVGCKNQTENITEQPKSNFNLEKDYAEFQTKMTELDTLKIWIGHSVCNYQGSEKIEITKKNGNIKIKTEYKEETFEKNPKWKVVYEKTISENDTIWNLGKFLKRNEKRLKSETKEFGILQIKHRKNKIQFYTHGLVDSNKFMSEYFETMIKIHPENKEKYLWI
ncbi:MAG TPA: hypothetical protein EYG92_01430 [Lutibacter sp.]|nr:hypothetical protein [Lutibacter sp.]